MRRAKPAASTMAAIRAVLGLWLVVARRRVIGRGLGLRRRIHAGRRRADRLPADGLLDRNALGLGGFRRPLLRHLIVPPMSRYHAGPGSTIPRERWDSLS